MSNFVKSKAYASGMFTDVNENAWYGYNQQKVIARAYEYGLMEGSSTTIFNPMGNMTLAQAVTVAVRVHSIYSTGHAVTSVSTPWYQGYVRYAVENSIIRADEFSDYNKAATRAEMAYIFAHALPSGEYPFRWYTKIPPDVTSSTPYVSDILKLYEAGIVGGNDDAGTFSPASNITRAQAAAILARLILPDTRIGLSYPMPS